MQHQKQLVTPTVVDMVLLGCCRGGAGKDKLILEGLDNGDRVFQGTGDGDTTTSDIVEGGVGEGFR